MNETEDKSEKKAGKSFFSGKMKAAAAALVILAGVGCFLGLKGRFSQAKAADLMQGIKPQKTDVSNASGGDFTSAAQKFSVDLFKNSYRNAQNGLVSPASAFFALGMVENGAGDQTAQAFSKVLGDGALSADEINKGCRDYADVLSQKRGSTVFNSSNSIWLKNDFKADKRFLQTNADFFGAAVRSVDFADKNAANTINAWAKEATDGKINEIANKISPDDVMHLINAVFFDAKWKYPFDTTKKASQNAFYLEDGSKIKTVFMNLEEELPYIKSKNAQAILLPYDDGRFSMLCIMPEGKTLKDYIGSMTEKTIPQLLSEKKNCDIQLELPQFYVSADNDLKGALENMGLRPAFDKGSADFSKMGKSQENIFLENVEQKSFIDVNELGTQAGAITDAGMQKQCITEPVNFNRPFIYAVLDSKTNLPLFLGYILEPQPSLDRQFISE